jgi:glyoxylase-like metal-dependent hydrolase (beta-lactamase superfamily II)
MAHFSSCAGIIIRSKGKVLIDTNMGSGETPGLLELEKPDAAVISHYHLDHSVWTRYVAEHSAALTLIPKKEEPYLTSLDFIISRTSGPFGMSEQWEDFVVNRRGYRPLTTYECYTEKTSFQDLVPEMVILETPGHSPSHFSFYFPDDKILFSGDVGLDRFGPWYGWCDCDIKDLVESVLRLDGLKVELVLTSHGGILKNEIRNAFTTCIRHILEREEKIVQKLDKGMDKQDIIEQGVFYTDKEKVREPFKSFLNMWDTAMYNHHEALIKEGGLVQFFPEIRGMV